MSGHSKWHTIRHQKGAADKARAKVFARLARQIEVAARGGGGDVEANPALRTMIQKAKSASMPKDNIDRAIKRGTGEIEGANYEAINYEGYASNGVAVYVETLSDNRNRTGAEIRSLFAKNGGSLAEPGAVAWQFERKGIIEIPKTAISEDDLMEKAIEAGALDIKDNGETHQIVTEATDVNNVKTELEKDLEIQSFDLTMIPSTTIAIEDPEIAKSVLKVIDALEDHDDVQNVFANCEISDDILQQL